MTSSGEFDKEQSPGTRFPSLSCHFTVRQPVLLTTKSQSNPVTVTRKSQRKPTLPPLRPFRRNSGEGGRRVGAGLRAAHDRADAEPERDVRDPGRAGQVRAARQHGVCRGHARRRSRAGARRTRRLDDADGATPLLHQEAGRQRRRLGRDRRHLLEWHGQ